MLTQTCTIRNAQPDEYAALGQLMVQVYSQLAGFPKPHEQPTYYHMLANIGDITAKPGAELLVAIDGAGKLLGGVVYFRDMQHYGSGGTATQEQLASGFRLLAVAPDRQGHGIGKLLTQACIAKAREHQNKQVIIHSTKAMQTAWGMYERLGFTRSEDLDFMQGELPVYGFRLQL
ncbi:GNAT family N-acetyltransferase [Pontibacter sp. Tf4]|uniref:GNAT family N-acetyltransferase n=1 Tax=Pontibacter sp. Tf4 TaxID=2761620 RepID=UPI001625B2B9|nr:GNAT family N-acetyltransferase [Pontibacter sp. Tf4]MBB6612863.1 GNAT family N-acetyltransferase [Pontibacter sp. Tf4]